MKTRLTVENPDNIEFTLKITMPLKDWKGFQAQLKTAWPSARLTTEIKYIARLTTEINSMIFQAINSFEPESIEKE